MPDSPTQALRGGLETGFGSRLLPDQSIRDGSGGE
jgi:hypothetical protein